MDQAAAEALQLDRLSLLALAKEGSTILCLGVPEGTEFGIDHLRWVVGDKFRGVKLVPPGVHFLHTIAGRPPGAPGKLAGGVSLCSGELVWVERGQVLVREWDARTETLGPHADADQVARLQLGVQRMDFDSAMAAYPLQQLLEWKSLTNFVTPQLLEYLYCRRPRAAQGPRRSPASASASSSAATSSSAASAEPEAKLCDLAESAHGSDHGDEDADLVLPGVRFTRIPAVAIPAGATPAQVTQLHVDRSEVLEAFLAGGAAGGRPSEDPAAALLGEFQCAFVVFVIGQSLAGLHQWKALTHLLSSCDRAVGEYPGLFTGFLEALAAQLRHVPEDFFRDALSGPSNFLRPCLRDLFEILESRRESLPASTRSAQARLRSLLLGRFRWDVASFDPEEGEDEDGPTIVELPEGLYIED